MYSNRQKREEERAKRREINRRNINLSYLIVIAVVLIALVIDYAVLSDLGEFSWREFFSDIVGNLMGVMGAFVVFDIIHDKLSKDSYADEVSDQILDTLLDQDGVEALDEAVKRKFVTASLKSLDTDKEAAEKITNQLEKYLSENADMSSVLERIDEFSDKQKNLFVRANVASIVQDDDASDMIQNYLDIYLRKNNDLRIRTNFSYELILSATLPEEYNNSLKHKDDYYLVHEMISYEVKFLNERMNNVVGNEGIVSIGFPYDNSSLDKFLRDGIPNQQEDEAMESCIFRESLSINTEDQELFESYSREKADDNSEQTKLTKLFKELFKPHLTIDGSSGELVDVESHSYGLIAKFKMEGNNTPAPDIAIHNVDIVFYMPKRWNGVLEIALVDPTKNPRISIDYPEDKMYVDMYSFLNKGEDTSYDNTHIEDNGMYRIILNNTWVFPVSGIIFDIKEKTNRS